MAQASGFNEGEHPRDQEGQFTDKVHGRPSGSLVIDDEDQDWGEVDVREGARTPWGKADWVDTLGPGVASAFTPSHGGVKLSPERNAVIPTSLRNRNGWYEEDAEISIVGMHHPDLFDNTSAEEFEANVRSSFPNSYEKATGNIIPVGESRIKDEQVWRDQNKDKWQVVSAVNSDDHPGMVEATINPVPTARTYGAEKRTMLIPEDVYEQGQNNGVGRHKDAFLVDPDSGSYTDITAPPPPPKPRYHGIDLSGLTEGQQSRARRDLEQRWRDPQSGKTRTLESIIENDGLTEKTAVIENGQRQYLLVAGDDHAYQVTKGTWSATEAPDRRSPSSRIADEINVAEARMERQYFNFDFDMEDIRRTKDRLGALRQKHAALRENEA